MKFDRSSGIILHPTSLPSADGIGDFGPDAYQWVNFLSGSGCSLWQCLPLGPTGYGDSPYQCFSAFAGNPYLISPTLLLKDGLIDFNDLSDRPSFPAELVNFGDVIPWKLEILNRAYLHYHHEKPGEIKSDFEEFLHLNSDWLEDFSLFMAIKESQAGASWDHWPKALRLRSPEALRKFKTTHLEAVEKHSFRQFLFYRQWLALRTYANEKGIRIIGDIPIFIAYDSADAWSHPDLFFMDQQGLPKVVAGVPPDYFSPTGQLWGNPLYDWETHRKTGYSWWIQRFRSILKTIDIVRLDHFRGFAGYWEIPYGMPTAEIGRWVTGPGASFFEKLQTELGDLPILAEDLGEITPDVIELRDKFNLPGMKIFQFAFSSDSSNPFLPHNYPAHCTAYTGTHDNDTALGWYHTAPEKELDFYRRYLARSGNDISWDMIRAVWSSVAVFAIAPLQDVLSLDSSARMNFPGKAYGNWTWRFKPQDLTDEIQIRLLDMNNLYSR
jgi:4-alpha-glucanotransferase